jgi:hypothetical protein
MAIILSMNNAFLYLRRHWNSSQSRLLYLKGFRFLHLKSIYY